MARKDRYSKRTTIWTGLFGEKHIHTEWVPDGSGCVTVVMVIIVLWVLFKGC